MPTTTKLPQGARILAQRLVLPVARETAVLRVNPALPSDPALRAIADDVAARMRFAMCAAAANPSAHRRHAFGEQFHAFLASRPAVMRQHAAERATALLGSPEVIKRATFGRYMSLAATDAAQLGPAGLGAKVGTPALDGQAVSAAFSRLTSALAKVPPEAGTGKVVVKSGTLPFTKLRLFVKRVRCIEETAEIGSDEILMSSVNSDPLGGTWIGHTWEVDGDMDEGDLVEYPGLGHKVTGWNLVTTKGWPCVYGTLLCMAEEDDGGFGAFLKYVWGEVREEVQGLAAGLVAGLAVGAATANVLAGIVAGVVVAIIDFLVSLLTDNKDEVARPAVLTLTLAAATKAYYDWAKLTSASGLTGVINYRFDTGHYRVLFGYKVFTS